MSEVNRDTTAKYAAEFVGAYVLVLTVICNGYCGDAAWAPLSVSCALTAMVYAFSCTSGACFNPSVSFALVLCGRMDPVVAGCNFVAQFLGGALAGVNVYALFWDREGLRLEPNHGFDIWDAAVVEIVYTAVLCFVVMSCLTSDNNNPTEDSNDFYALAIGFAMLAGGYTATGISGACFNPAVAIGIFTSNFSQGIHGLCTYLSCHILGGILATVVLRLLRAERSLMPRDTVPMVGLREKLVGESAGTFVLAMTVTLNALQKSPMAPISSAAALSCMFYSLAGISGAHFNPAVTLGVYLSGREKCTLGEGAAYVGVQVLAGLAAVLLSLTVIHDGLTPLASEELWWGSVGGAEAIFTFLLTFAVLSTSTAEVVARSPSTQNNVGGLSVGMCAMVGGTAVGSVSAGAFNPAVAIGLLSVPGKGRFDHCLYYVGVQLAAGAAAALVFFVTRPHEYAPPLEHSPEEKPTLE